LEPQHGLLNDAPLPHEVVIDRKRPGVGYRHVLTKRDIVQFIELLPNWQTLAVGLNAIVLASGEDGTDGYHAPGVVYVCAWEADLWREISPEYYADHRDILERLDVQCEEMENGWYLCKFSEAAVRGYQLLHILLHELGHHHDRMTSRLQQRARRGESYAEEYARHYEAVIWLRYLEVFSW
jgi:hypothetical protein